MRFTFAVNPNLYQLEMMADTKAQNVLVSYAYSKGAEEIKHYPEFLILDSGAFSAWTLGKPMDIVAFADWALSKQDVAKKVVTVNLDVIPGEFGRSSTHTERIAGMKQSIENADYLRSRGLEIMEVFHQDEPLIFLDTLLDRLPYGQILGISPRNDMPVASKERWQSVILRHLVKRYGVKNLPKTHGLAVTAMRLMRGFPYYSVDSSTWAAPMRFGTFTNKWGKMEPTENILPKRANISLASEGVRLAMRESVEAYIHIGKEMTTLWESRGVKWKD